MRQLVLAAGAVCAAAATAHWAAAQNPTGAMPGQVVGNGINFSPVGAPFPKVAPAAGKPINLPDESPLMRRYDPSRPLDAFRGTAINPASVVAPVQGFGNQTALERWYDKVKSAVGLSQPVAMMPAPPNVTPGIFRRNRERKNEMLWRRD